MNRTMPHRGGVPKGTSWTRMAADLAEAAPILGTRWFSYNYVVRACRIIRDHSRCDATRAEASRLLAILEHRTASEARAECLRSGPLFRQDETAHGQAVGG